MAGRSSRATSWDCATWLEVNDLQAAVDGAATQGFVLVGGIGEYEGVWRMAYVRGPEGIIVSLAERLR